MWKYPVIYDVIVIGAGHAGCEAAAASAKKGAKTLLLTMNLDTVGKMSCNPAIGGIGKGHIVREIDALGGIMGKITDATAIQRRMLNRSKGAAVQAPRAQADKWAYQCAIKHHLEQVAGLELKQGTIEELLVENGKIVGLATKEGIIYRAKSVVLSSGTFMRGMLHVGDVNYAGGRAGDAPSMGLSAGLEKLGLKLGRLKTGTPPRINKRSIDFSLTEEQPGEEGVFFSFDQPGKKQNSLPQISCHITYTTAESHKIILDNLHRSALYGGKISGVGPRYCPSIETKIVRFSDKERHQIFLEPEGLGTEEVYVNGISSSLPIDVQYEFIHAIPALRHAEVMRPAYAIEYDYVLSGQVDSSLQCHSIAGLFLAGQINGTTGYEEAAAQGFITGVNAACYALELPAFSLKRSEAYIGVLIDDLITRGIDEGLKEPYRMFTSHAEHRLLLRQDNADLRLRHYGYDLGLISEEQHQATEKKRAIIAQASNSLAKTFRSYEGRHSSLSALLCRPELCYSDLLRLYPNDVEDFGSDINQQIELFIKYEPYIARQQAEINKQVHFEHIKICKGFDFSAITGLRTEAKEKLSEHRPDTVGRASRILGVSPADISILMVALRKQQESRA
jgi:tRNA uridine 5-carboxymethylaminomethyl modification enzyme